MPGKGGKGTAAAAWVGLLTKAKKTCMVNGGRKKIHFTFDDGQEMVEEWDVKADTLCLRKWRKPQTLGGQSQWDFEVGEADVKPPAQEGFGMMVSNVNPIAVRKDTKTEFQWRIRNLPYGLDVYSMTVNDDDDMVLRTSNKKYYKKLQIKDLQRLGIPLDATAITMAHANNTLIVTYKKPAAYLDADKQLKVLRDKMKATEDGEVDCATQ